MKKLFRVCLHFEVEGFILGPIHLNFCHVWCRPLHDNVFVGGHSCGLIRCVKMSIFVKE